MTVLDAVVGAAERWRDPGCVARARAARRTLSAPNRFTEEALAFAINQQMHQVTHRELDNWLRGRRAQSALRVGVLNAGNIPLAGLQDFLAVVLTGHEYIGVCSSKSPALLPAFAECIGQAAPGIRARFRAAGEMWAEAEAVVATGSDATGGWIREQARAHALPERRLLARGHTFAVAVVDGKESRRDLEGLAEDILLHEGMGCRSVALLWAPQGISPDAMLESLAAFRSVFPAHSSTPGALSMQKAFLQSLGVPHAYGDGLEFLVSRGAPEPKGPAHLRWAEYDSLREVEDYMETEGAAIQLVVARPGLAARLRMPREAQPPGSAHRPRLDWCPDGRDTVDFLAGLGAPAA